MELTIPDRKFIAIDYPGIVNNIDKAFYTLGGLKQLHEAAIDINKRIKLNFRPDNPYCRPAYGDKNTKYCLLVKVRRKKQKNKNDTNSNVDDKEPLEGEILGTVDTIITFTSMCDFQYLPMSRDPNGTYTNHFNDLVLKDIQAKEWFSKPTPLFLIPPFFSRFDQPTQYCFREKSTQRRYNFPENCIGISRSRRPHFTKLYKFSSTTIPTHPNPEAILKIKKMQIPDWKVERIKMVLMKQPVYTTVALLADIGPLITREDLKVILPTLTYHCVDGPWRAMWIKFGYDLRAHPEAKIYQNLDFRQERKMSLMFKNKIKAKRSAFDYNLPTTVTKGHVQHMSSIKRQPTTFSASTTTTTTTTASTTTTTSNMVVDNDGVSGGGGGGGGNDATTMAATVATEAATTASSVTTFPVTAIESIRMKQMEDEYRKSLESSYIFKPELTPKYRQMFYHLCHIQVPEVQVLVHLNDGREVECTEKDGWCLPDTIDKCRAIINSYRNQKTGDLSDDPIPPNQGAGDDDNDDDEDEEDDGVAMVDADEEETAESYDYSLVDVSAAEADMKNKDGDNDDVIDDDDDDDDVVGNDNDDDDDDDLRAGVMGVLEGHDGPTMDELMDEENFNRVMGLIPEDGGAGGGLSSHPATRWSDK